jgi:uncharacterized membrane protein
VDGRTIAWWGACVLGLCALLSCTGDRPSSTGHGEFRASGNEPFWSVLVTDTAIAFHALGSDRLVFREFDAKETPSGFRFVAVGPADRGALVLDLVTQPCNDSMADVRYEFQASVIAGGVSYSGCAKRGLDPAGEGASRTIVDLEAVRNATYVLSWADAATVQLRNGEFSGEAIGATHLRVHLTDWVAFGDLDTDGMDEAVAVLATDPGGSGTFYELAVVADVDGVPVNVASQLLGDRIVMRGLSVSGGLIELAMTTHGTNDPMCCPREDVLRRFRWDGTQLVEV